MRATTIAIALLLTVPALSLGVPVADAAEYPAPPFVFFYQNPGSGPVADVYVTTQDGVAWDCDTQDDSGLVNVDITVTCTGVTVGQFKGRCIGLRVGAQAGSGPYPGVPGGVLDLISPVTAPPPVAENLLEVPTRLKISSTCGAAATQAVIDPTPGAAASVAAALPSDQFSCRVQVDNGQGAAPWNAFCYGA